MKSYSEKVNKTLASLLFCGAILSATGCTQLGWSGHNYTSTPNATSNGILFSKSGVYPQTENALEIISQESQRALEAQKMLVKYRQQYSATLESRQRSFEEDQVAIDYIGKPQPLLTSIAIRYGYRFLEVGQLRDLGTVNFTNNWTTPENAVMVISAQLGNEATISLDKNNKVITLIYR